jgi:serine phosphatase RsbU (regulator of sigma subunit)
MVARGRMLGAISFLRAGAFSDGELELLEDLTGRAALSFDNARLYAERAHVAHTLRDSLMPAALPEVPGLQLESYFKPMGAGGEVGGDFYDVFADRGNCWLVIGDVCGKGAEAAVLTGFLRHTTVAYAREASSPAGVLERVNKAMLENDFEGRFATVVLARLTFSTGGVELTLATAGHPGALVSRGAGGAEELGAFGTLLGVFPDPEIAERTTTLQPGDALALYTDGLTEAHAPARVLTVEEMVARLAEPPPRSARDTIDSLLGLAELDERARDDVAILALQVTGVPSGRAIDGAPPHTPARAAAPPANLAQSG